MHSHSHDTPGRFDPEAPIENAHTIPSSWYYDPECYDKELRLVFGRCWLAAERNTLVSRPNSFFTTNVAQSPVVVARDAKGILRAFHNVCRHRAARVVTEAQGSANRFQCRYHGWTYDLAGQLRGVPEFEGVANFVREEEGLVPLSVNTWGPFVWIHPDAAPPPLTEFLAPLPERIVEAGMERLLFTERRIYDVGCNWKVYVDNFLDGGYHVNSVHPGLSEVLDYSRYSTEVSGNTSVQSSLLNPEDSVVGAVRTGSHVHYWWVFPNFFMSLYSNLMITSVLRPLGPERVEVVVDFFFGDGENVDTRHDIEQSIAVSDQIQAEDIEICEDVQRGLRSGAFETGRYSVKREVAVYHFHRLLASWLHQATG
jgi:choline monooxygenase